MGGVSPWEQYSLFLTCVPLEDLVTLPLCLALSTDSPSFLPRWGVLWKRDLVAFIFASYIQNNAKPKAEQAQCNFIQERGKCIHEWISQLTKDGRGGSRSISQEIVTPPWS